MTNIIVVGVDDSSGARGSELGDQTGRGDGQFLRVVHAFDLNFSWLDYDNPDLPKWEQRAHRRALIASNGECSRI